MRAVAVSVWIFINLVFVGMCGYIYLLWSQYWRYVERQQSQMAGILSSNTNNGYSNSNSQVFYYYHGSSSETNPNVKPTRDDRTVPKHHLKERRNRTLVTVIRRRSQPRFAKLRQVVEMEPDKLLLRCAGNADSPECAGEGLSDIPPPANYKLSSRCNGGEKPPVPPLHLKRTGRGQHFDKGDTAEILANFYCVICQHCVSISLLTAGVAAYKSQLVVQLRRVLLEESSVFKARGDANNPYNVQYSGPRGSYAGRSVRELVCELERAVRMRMLAAEDEPFRRRGLAGQFPKVPLLGAGGRHYNMCAIVTNAGSLDGSGLGKFIDKHDLVVRFNHAPTEGYENDVGSKTTIRIVNSQVVSKAKFDFLGSPLYRDVDLLAWDPSNYSSTLDEWYNNPDFDLFTPYFKHRALFPEHVFHILDPRSQWSLWEFIQSHIPVRIRKNPPSSGFLGLALMLPHCSHVDLFEYVPSVRLTKRCHYWDVAEDMSCTFGVWHPLAAEKLLALALNVASDLSVFSDGQVEHSQDLKLTVSKS